MGRLTAVGIVETELPLSEQLQWHLQGNFFPAIPIQMITPCLEAIDAYWEDDYNRLISMPVIDGFQVGYKGLTVAPAWAIIEQHHLEPWCELSEDGHCLDCDSTHAVDMPCEDE
jgi:hypothetical protein